MLIGNIWFGNGIFAAGVLALGLGTSCVVDRPFWMETCDPSYIVMKDCVLATDSCSGPRLSKENIERMCDSDENMLLRSKE